MECEAGPELELALALLLAPAEEAEEEEEVRKRWVEESRMGTVIGELASATVRSEVLVGSLRALR